jgi:6-phosphogluconolactonase
MFKSRGTILFVIFLCGSIYGVFAFNSLFVTKSCVRNPKSLSFFATTTPLQPFLPSVDPDNVIILKDAADVSRKIQSIVTEAARKAISERGHFALAIPGGSVLKMLANLPSFDEWASKTTVVYVNHKCVEMDDIDRSTHAKAIKLFLGEWERAGLNTIVLDGTADGEQEARRYEEKIKSLEDIKLPRDSRTGLPQFDLALIGVGDDGHIGSLYPNRDEVLVDESGPWVLCVPMKNPPSITLSLPLMKAASKVVVAACGVSDKYPQGKSAGMKRAIIDDETLQSFPAAGLRDKATWVMDEAAASKLGPNYHIQ